MKITIHHRFKKTPLFKADLHSGYETKSYGVQLGAAVQLAAKFGIDLYAANLAGVDLAGADLKQIKCAGANLIDANLSGADLTLAQLSGAYLSGANLSDANLTSASLAGAYLWGANLIRSNFSGANLTRANIEGTRLAQCNLSTAKGLSDRQLKETKNDFWKVLSHNRIAVPRLNQALQEGRVDGAIKYGPCANLHGTLANIRGCDIATIGHPAHRPSERWFASIQEGDLPGEKSTGGFAAKKALQWSVEFCDLAGINPGQICQ